MNEATRKALAAVNRRFYARHGASFSRSRGRPWPGWERLLGCLSLPAGEGLRVLDVGCGNARFATFLRARIRGDVDYLGLDNSPELVAEARRLLARPADDPDACEARIEELDLVDHGMPQLGHFHLICLFGVVHHVPGREARRQLVADLAGRLRPRGLLALTLWRFDRLPRYAEKLIPWEGYNPTATPPLDLSQIEGGDYLLSWAGDRSAPRYCHLTGEAEAAELVAASGLRLAESFSCDGPGGQLNLYLLLRAGS